MDCSLYLSWDQLVLPLRPESTSVLMNSDNYTLLHVDHSCQLLMLIMHVSY